MRHRLVTLLGLGALLALSLPLAGCGREGQAEGAGDEIAEIPVNVRTLTMQRADLQEHLTISGALRPVHATDVSTEETGVVRAIPSEKGARVSRGDVVVLLERDVLEAEKRSAEASRELAAYTAERTKKLWEEQQASREEALRAETVLEEAEARGILGLERDEKSGGFIIRSCHAP